LPPRRIGVLLVNLGTPDGTSYWPMRRYLKEFLSDRRVIEVNRLLWWPLLNLVILTTRPGRKGRDYEKIWNMERDEGPLRTITRAQAGKLAEALGAHALGGDRLGGDTPGGDAPGAEGAELVVDWAMRYGTPRIGDRLDALQAQGCDRILLVPLYPQYAAATTATVCDVAFRHLTTRRWQPALRVAPAWYDDPAYVEALATTLEAGLAKLDFEPEVVLASFHGVPQATLEAGDPYHCQCLKTARLLRERLGWPKDRLVATFQSRFGRDPWVQPYTDHTVEALARRGVKRLAIVAPGFAADCLETLEELDGENREIFQHHGGERFAYIPCLNDGPEGIGLLGAVVRRELAGWVKGFC
jgi:ferrochelatase